MPKKLEGNELLTALKRQVEFYFARQNLANDAYLVSQMDSQMYVPISVIGTFAKVKELTCNTELIADAIRDSKVCSLNDESTAIRPNIKAERNTIILREIPSATPVVEVEGIFADCGKVSNVRSDVGDAWFVTMETENDAVNTLLRLRTKTFQDKPIKARLKSENILRSFYRTPMTDGVSSPYGNAAHGSAGYYGAPVGYMGGNPGYGHRYGQNGRMGRSTGYGLEGGRYGFRAGGSNNNRSNKGSASATRQGYNNANVAKEGRGRNGGVAQPGDRKKGKDKKSKSADVKRTTTDQPLLNVANFPPLPTPTDKKEPMPEPATDTCCRRYSHEEILEIIKGMSESEIEVPPGTIDYQAHEVALTEVAHQDLLRNQRTYSIEQAREAMRQGRPIRGDSIGSVDYESMMYGEDYTSAARQARQLEKESPIEIDEAAKLKKESTVLANGNLNNGTTSVPEIPVEQESVSTSTPIKGGYAAALLNGAAAPAAHQRTRKAAVNPSKGEKEEKRRKDQKKNQGHTLDRKSPKKGDAHTSLVRDPSAVAQKRAEVTCVWGGKRSFVEVLKAKNEVSATSTTGVVIKTDH